MTPESMQKLKQMLTIDEGYKQFPYTDTTGHLTIAIGRNLTDRGISAEEAQVLLEDDIDYFYKKLSSNLPFFDELVDNRKIALINMCFNIGFQGFLKFKSMIIALEAKDYERAAHEISSSKYATQNIDRAIRIASIMLTGDL